MSTKHMMLFLFSALVVNTDAFFFSSSSASRDCAWLPWEYTACTKSGSGYLKLEKRKKIALRRGATCSSQTETRRTRSCTVSEFIASTILSSVTNRETKTMNTFAMDRSDRAYPPICSSFLKCAPPPPGRPTISTPQKTTTTTTTTATPTKICASTFTDSVSGVKMLGADCGIRKRRSARVSESAKSRTKRQFGGTVESVEHRDILFMLDESGSVGKNNLKKQLEFVEVISEKFSDPRHIGRTATRVAVTTFASDHKHHIDLLDSANLGDFKHGLNRVTYRGGLTCLIDALRAARTEVFTRSGGSRIPFGTADGLIILVTDGCFNCHGGDLRTALQTEQNELENMGVTILTFMINVGGSCENSLRALQDGSSCFRGFSYPSWQKFDDQIQDFKNMGGVIDRWTKESAACP